MFSDSSTHTESVFSYIKETAHNELSDFSFVARSMLRMAKQGGTINPKIYHKVVLDSCYNFLHSKIPCIARADPVESSDYFVAGRKAFDDLYSRIESVD